VASIMFDPARDPEWIGGARSVEWHVSDPTAIGAKVTRHGAARMRIVLKAKLIQGEVVRERSSQRNSLLRLSPHPRVASSDSEPGGP